MAAQIFFPMPFFRPFKIPAGYVRQMPASTPSLFDVNLGTSR